VTAVVAGGVARERARACGKVILLGEHFVVPHVGTSHTPAIAFPLPSLSCEVEISRASRASCVAEGAPDGARPGLEERMARAVQAAAAALLVDPRGLRVRSRATFPISRGFGSSAAFSVALSRALRAFAESRPSPHDAALQEAAHAAEAVFHGTPSGLDTAVILAERGIRFHHSHAPRHIPRANVDLVAIDSGPREGAATMITRVRELRSRDPETWSRLASRTTELVDLCERALAAGDAPLVGKLLDTAHAILADLNLSHARIEQILSDARAVGALGGKVSGAGAGGAVVLVARGGDGGRLAGMLRSRGHSIVGVAS
jgi:mevalonate kinase